MTFSVMLARQRTGTGALNTLFGSSLDITCTEEIFAPHIHNEHSLSSLAADFDCLHLADATQLLLNRFAADTRHFLLDVKLNSLNFMSPPFRSFVHRPWLLDLFAKHSARIICVDRNPVFQWVSGRLAEKTNTWHAFSGAKLPTERIEINIGELQGFLEQCQNEDAKLQDWLKDFRVLKLCYEEVFRSDDFGNTIDKVAEFLEIKRLAGWEKAKPKTIKQVPADLSQVVINFSDLAPFLPGSERKVAMNDGLSRTNVAQTLSALPEHYRAVVNRRLDELDMFIEQGLVPLDRLNDGVVLDWECGNGSFSVALLLRGARQVIAIDNGLDLNQLPREVKEIDRLDFLKMPIDLLASIGSMRFDLVFANTVTEHMQNIPAVSVCVHSLLRPGGAFFTNHDNYYQPVGSHDHGFLFYGEGGIVQQGPKCWEHEDKCHISEEHRANVGRKLPWTWDDRNERTKNPQSCSDCDYFKRSRPWAHLIYQDEFARLFPQPAFSTGKSGSSLNKLTPFQLRQFFLEAGFDVELEARATVGNVPPAELLEGFPNFSADDLRTSMYRLLCRRRLGTS